MNNICSQNECTACFACANVCPKSAISFVENEYGILYPEINQNLCVNCYACEKVCPNKSKRTFVIPKSCYVAWRTDDKKRRRSASGGIANAFSEYIINKENGSVWGVETTSDFEAVFKEYTDISELEKTKGSKYVHSHILYELKTIKQRLNEEKKVLFIGLPCQVAGLLNYLGKDYDNLVTCDLICHGVLPGSYLQNEINFLRHKRHRAEIASCSFRDNAGSNFCFVLYNSQGRSCYRKQAYFQPYFSAFLQAVALRPNCNKCKYARPERISDITLGDYIGLGKDAPFSEKSINNSMVTINSGKGQDFWNSFIKDNVEIKSFERDYNKAVPFQPSLVKPFAPHSYTDKFLKKYKILGFAKAARKTFSTEIKIRNLKRMVYILLHLYKAPRKIIRCLKK